MEIKKLGYETPQLEITIFETEDIITTSPPAPGDIGGGDDVI